MNAVRRFTLARPLAAAAVAMALVAPAGDFTAIAAEPPVDEGRSVGPALALSDPIYEAAREAQDSAVVAGDAGVRLAAWRDHRTFEQTHGDIYATRLAADGTVLDPAGIAIVTLPEAQTTPAISWSGEVFLIVWADSRDPWEAHGVYGARVTGAGEVLDPDGFAIGLTSDPSRAYPQVAWDGTTFLVTWQGDAARLAGRSPRTGASATWPRWSRGPALRPGWQPSADASSPLGRTGGARWTATTPSGASSTRRCPTSARTPSATSSRDLATSSPSP